MNFAEKWSIQSKIRNLNRYKNDLADDQSAIVSYNKHINSAISDFRSFVKTGAASVPGKLEEYKEPYQYNDSSLNTAKNYIEREVSHLSRKLEEAD